MGRTGTEHDGAQRAYGQSPEQAVGIRVYARVEIVHLGREVIEVKLTCIEVQSNEAERPPVDLPVDTHVHPAHEAHVCVEKQSVTAVVAPRAPDVGYAN